MLTYYTNHFEKFPANSRVSQNGDKNMSTSFTEERLKEKMPLASALKKLKEAGFQDGKNFISLGVGRELESKPHKVGVLFSGGPAAGGSNVIAGLYDALMELNPSSKLLGFLGGAGGLLKGEFKELSSKIVDQYRNLGGFHMLGTGRGKIETEQQFEEVAKMVIENHIDAIVFVGGDDTNTNASHLATYFKKQGNNCSIIGIPKTIDGDLKSDLIETSFGFDTACKVYSEMISNICIDAKSSLKYSHFIKLMGRSASHVTLECSLQTMPNLTIISEEVAQKKMSLGEVVKLVTDTVQERAKSGKSYGVYLLPEGLIEFIPEFSELISELNRILARGKSENDLPPAQKVLFDSLPTDIAAQLLQDRDPHGNVQVSHIQTEKLIYGMVAAELEKRNFEGAFKPIGHFFGYEGRCSCPSFFDATYCYNLGFVAIALINHRKSGMMAALRDLHKKVNDWRPIAVEIKSMMVEEERKGVIKKVIKKSVVELDSPPFKKLKSLRKDSRIHDRYEIPGPIQYHGPSREAITKTLEIEAKSKKSAIVTN